MQSLSILPPFVDKGRHCRNTGEKCIRESFHPSSNGPSFMSNLWNLCMFSILQPKVSCTGNINLSSTVRTSRTKNVVQHTLQSKRNCLRLGPLAALTRGCLAKKIKNTPSLMVVMSPFELFYGNKERGWMDPRSAERALWWQQIQRRQPGTFWT